MNSLRSLLVVSLLSFSVLTTCGGGSSKEDPVALCKQGCSKAVDLCAADFGGLIDPAAFKATCEAGCADSAPSGAECKNSSAIIAAAKTCLSKNTCAELMSCSDSIPECQGGSTGTGGASGTGTGGASGTGTGGASGTGTGGRSGGTGGASGTGGAGGSSGGGCTALQACCAMITSATDRATCQAAAAAAQPSVCDAALSAIRAQGLCL